MYILHIVLVVAVLLESGQAKSRAEEYRLSEIFVPSSYGIELSLTPEAFTATNNEFLGRATVRFSVTNITNFIALHAHHGFITINRIVFGNITYDISGTTTVAGEPYTTVSPVNDIYNSSNIFTSTSNTTDIFNTSDTFNSSSNTTDTLNITEIVNATTETTSEIINLDFGFTNVSINYLTDILTINLTYQITTGVIHELIIDYTGRLSTTDMYGFYKSNYIDGAGVTKYLLATQFQPTHARRVFPCFDEPALKARFDLTITVPTGLNVLFNTQPQNVSTDITRNLTTTTFYTTPRMSTYLVAFVVSEFTCTSGVTIGSVPYQVCSRNESAATREVAVEYGPRLLTALNNFTNYDYGAAIGKLDQVAIPDFAAGAMENWGLITYRETSLLWDRNESSNRYQQRIVTVIAHEFSHQWFGNLVTMKWWSEAFLNEGFATYFEYHTTNEVLPSWELKKQFVIEELQLALLSDALETAQALQSASSTPAEISSRFGTISYSKGGSVLRMVEHFMLLENFKAGLQNYLISYEYNNTVPEDLWIALNRSVVNSVSRLPVNLTAVMANWVKLPGFPLISVRLNGNRVIVSQKKFLLSGEDSTSQWYVPISFTISTDTNKFTTTTPNVWLIPDQGLEIPLPQDAQWIILNNQQSGYYRVNYDDTLWGKIRTALIKDNFDGITEINRAQIVDDLFNLARANQIRYSSIFNVMTFLYNDISYYTWYSAFAGYNFLLRRVGENSSLGRAISNDILETMGKLYLSVPISTIREDDQIYTLKQVLTHSWACRLGAITCIEEIKRRFDDYKSSGIRPNKNLRGVVYCYALKYSNNSFDWDFLWNAYLNSTSLATEQVTILTGLGCTTNASLLREYLNKSITAGSGIRAQDALSVFSSVYGGSSAGVDVAFNFLIENYQAIIEKYQSMNSLGNLVKGIAERFTTESQIARLRNFTENGNLTEAFRISANEAIETAEANLRWLQQFENDIRAYYSTAIKYNASFAAIIVTLICIIITW